MKKATNSVNLWRCIHVAMALSGLMHTTHANSTAVVHATQTNFREKISNIQAGQTLALHGTFNEFTLRDRDFGGVIVDASAAHFTGGFVFRNVHNITFKGGIYGLDTGPLRRLATIQIFDSTNVSLAYGEHLGWSLGRGIGVSVSNSQFVTVRDSKFSNMRLGVGYTSVSDSLIARNSFTSLSSDGINIAGSYRVIASHNYCSNFVVSAGSHPDCIQLWSLPGTPVQSDISLLNNVALGNTQGFTNFDSARGAIRVTMAGNYVHTNLPQGIACYNCVDSTFSNNILIAERGARWRTSLNVIGGRNNTIENNQLYDNRLGNLSIPQVGSNWVNLQNNLTGRVGSAHDIRDYGLLPEEMSAASNAVPEPSTWITFLFGFGAIGVTLRRKPQRSIRGSGLEHKAPI